MAGFSSYFAFAASSLESKIASLSAEKEKLQAPVTVAAQDAEGTAIDLTQALSQIETNQLSWSKIIEKIETTVPKYKDSAQPVASFRSYNGSPDGKISVSATTQAGAPDPFGDVALLVRSFAAEPSFKNVFVPSITKSITPEGAVVLSFSISFEYVRPEKNS